MSKVTVAKVLSSCVALFLTLASVTQAHEVLPTIADMTRTDDGLVFDVELNLESFIAGIDQASTLDTNDAAESELYDELRALEPAELDAAFREFWPEMASKIDVIVDGSRGEPELTEVAVAEVGNFELPRNSQIQFVVPLSDGADKVAVGWAPEFGALVLRQMGVDAPYDGFLEAGSSSPDVSLAGGDQANGWQTFVNYIPVGFDHIVPKGLDHILFVLGLFFLSTRMGPLLWQISAFTLAHTITLALAALGYVNLSGTLFAGSIETIVVVEALIALSIVYVAIENLFTEGLSPWRPFIIFGFGLLHGLGFASVLAEFGLPQSSFIPALIGFNIGVEIGQIGVVAVAYLIVMKAVSLDKSGTADKMAAAAYLAVMVALMALIIPVSGWSNGSDVIILIVTGAILLGLSAASSVVGRYDSYREMVAMPGSILIGVVAVYWCVERLFL